MEPNQVIGVAVTLAILVVNLFVRFRLRASVLTQWKVSLLAMLVIVPPMYVLSQYPPALAWIDTAVLDRPYFEGQLRIIIAHLVRDDRVKEAAKGLGAYERSRIIGSVVENGSTGLGLEDLDAKLAAQRQIYEASPNLCDSIAGQVPPVGVVRLPDVPRPVVDRWVTAAVHAIDLELARVVAPLHTVEEMHRFGAQRPAVPDDVAYDFAQAALPDAMSAEYRVLRARIPTDGRNCRFLLLTLQGIAALAPDLRLTASRGFAGRIP